MKPTSKYFDQIRVTKRGAKPEPVQAPSCQWKGCETPGTHKAPMGRGRDGQFFLFCLDHVREYNAKYNYFSGMSDEEVADFQKDALTGHRPTWKAGANAWAHGKTGTKNAKGGKSASGAGDGPKSNDPHAFFAWRAKREAGVEDEPRRYMHPLSRKSLEALHLNENATKDEIKARFKDLVKRHHPDANGGDTRSEEKLREIIQAYNTLKQAGLV